MRFSNVCCRFLAEKTFLQLSSYLEAARRTVNILVEMGMGTGAILLSSLSAS